MRNRKTRREKIRSEQRRLQELNSERNQLLRLKEKLEARIPEKRKKKNIAFHVRNLKIVRETGRFLVPFVVCAGIAIGGGALFGAGLPLKEDHYTKIKQTSFSIESQVDSKELEERYVSYGPLDSVKDSSLTVYTPWEEVETEEEDSKKKMYRRQKRVYESGIANLEVVKALINNDFDTIINSIKDYKLELQTCSEIFEEPAYRVEGNIYFVDKEDRLTFPEDPSTDMWVTIIEALITLGFGGIIAYKRDFEYVYQLKKDYREYRSKYKEWKEDVDKLKETNNRLLSLRIGDR